MPLATRIDDFKVVKINGLWEANCDNNPSTFLFHDLPNAVFQIAQYAFCDCGNHRGWIHKDTSRIVGFPREMLLSDFIDVAEFFDIEDDQL